MEVPPVLVVLVQKYAEAQKRMQICVLLKNERAGRVLAVKNSKRGGREGEEPS